MQKIIFVSNTSWYLYNFRLGVIKLFQQQNFEVICIANWDEYSEKLEQHGVTFIQSSLANKGTNPIKDYAYYRFLYKTYKSINPSFIFHYTIKPNIYGSLAAKKAGVPSIAIVSGAGYVFLHNNWLTKISKKLYSKAAKACTEMWFVNTEDEHMFQRQKIVHSSKTRVLPGEGINTELFKRDKPYPVHNSDFTFLLSGRMLWDKGVGIFVEAARLIKTKYTSVKFQLLGFIDDLNPSAISQKQITSWVNEGIIDYLGATDNVRPFLNKINSFVLPSYYKEGVPKALLEGASMEIPLIATDNIGCREVVEDGYNGFLCEIKSSQSLADKMEKMICLPKQELIEMGKNGRTKVMQHFHENFVLDYYLNTIKKYIQPPV